jgi:hypothetical protein
MLNKWDPGSLSTSLPMFLTLFFRLEDNNLKEYKEKFKDEEIDGIALLAITEQDLKDLRVKMGHRSILALCSSFFFFFTFF